MSKQKTIKEIIDYLILKKTPISLIAKIIGKKEIEIWNYIYVSFRKKNPMFYSENEKYFMWGYEPIDLGELKQLLKKTIDQELEILKNSINVEELKQLLITAIDQELKDQINLEKLKQLLIKVIDQELKNQINLEKLKQSLVTIHTCDSSAAKIYGK